MHQVTTQAIYFAISAGKIKPVTIGKSKFIKKSQKYEPREKNNSSDNKQVTNK